MQWEHPQARVVSVTRGGEVVCDERRGVLWSAPVGPYDPETVLCVGQVDGVPYFAVVVPESSPTVTLRYLSTRLSDTEHDVVTTAVALANWHTVAPYCGICGRQTEVRSGGHVRWCAACERERFPRTDPAVIAAVVDARDRLLLGHQVTWKPGRVSLLAGFVESGESVEQAIRREVREEAAVEVGVVDYFGSQPHPFPRSLMLAFVAEALTTDVHVDGNEVEWAGFFTREEVVQKMAAGRVTLPTRSSIATRMIHLWLDSKLPPPGAR